MVRIQVRLTEEQAQALKRMAAEQQVSVAEIVRRSVDSMIRTSAGGSEQERWRRAVAVAGRFHSGKTDVGRNHDLYLVEAYES